MITLKDIEGSKYSHIYNKNLPDKTSEFFWYCFKESIINAINDIKSKNTTKTFGYITSFANNIFDIDKKNREKEFNLYH